MNLLVCHVVYRSVQDSYCTIRDKRYMTDQQIYMIFNKIHLAPTRATQTLLFLWRIVLRAKMYLALCGIEESDMTGTIESTVVLRNSRLIGSS